LSKCCVTWRAHHRGDRRVWQFVEMLNFGSYVLGQSVRDSGRNLRRSLSSFAWHQQHLAKSPFRASRSQGLFIDAHFPKALPRQLSSATSSGLGRSNFVNHTLAMRSGSLPSQLCLVHCPLLTLPT
jgi:hypothetical protein